MSRTIILTSYVETPFDMAEVLKPDDQLICTDGGYDIALEYGLKPDLLLGDFDSVDAMLPDDIPIMRFRPEKDYTDLQLAIDTALEKGATNIEIWGGIGGRLDHTIANTQLLSRYTDRVDFMVLRDGANEAFALTAMGTRKLCKIPAHTGWYVSLFALSDEVRGLAISGAKYELDGYTMSRNYPIGVSNEFTDDVLNLSFDSGTLLVVLSKK